MEIFTPEQLATLHASFNDSKRAALHPYIKGVFEVAKLNNVYWLRAKEVAERLNTLGIIDHQNAKALGDTLGNHVDGMKLKSKRIGGHVHYSMFDETSAL